ncbi:MAG: PIG-L family deacetylase [Clostridia bacterium]|nr:PIG-L family deacetylase [Clostridia bacterium]
MKRILSLVLIVVTLILLLPTASVSAEETVYAPDLTSSNVSSGLRDNSAETYETLEEITISSDSDIKSLYIVFRKTALGFTVDCNNESSYFEGKYLQYYADISGIFTGETKSVTITFDDAVSICEIHAFGEGTLPEFVHNWNAPLEKADLLLFSTHADDEHLFFAGILPYYAGVMGYRVQVAYFTDHVNNPERRHEMLDGLWTVGIKNYPVISDYPDQKSESYEEALANLTNRGYTEDDIIAYQTMLLRRFKPMVAVGHDLEGEYGHGQHMLNAHTLTKAVELAADENAYPDSVVGCGTWDTPKLYLHLYNENPITLNWDTPLQCFDGLSAFQVSKKGFDHHKTQHKYFKDWLGYDSASEVTEDSPCYFGLYRSTVGEDIKKNDFFENITTYAEQERIAAEEAARLEEELKLQQEESQKAEEETELVFEEETIEEAEENVKAKEDPDKPTFNTDIILFIVIAVIAIASVVVTVSFSKKTGKKKK